jgi:hypothetical protein
MKDHACLLHELRNCMSVLLLNVENLEAGYAGPDLKTIETTIQKMKSLTEELAELLLRPAA